MCKLKHIPWTPGILFGACGCLNNHKKSLCFQIHLDKLNLFFDVVFTTTNLIQMSRIHVGLSKYVWKVLGIIWLFKNVQWYTNNSQCSCLMSVWGIISKSYFPNFFSRSRLVLSMAEILTIRGNTNLGHVIPHSALWFTFYIWYINCKSSPLVGGHIILFRFNSP